MAGHVCFIRQAETQLREPVEEVARALNGWHSSEVLWRNWPRGMCNGGAPALLVAATEAPDDCAMEFLHWFLGLDTKSIRIALLHEDCPETVIDSAARSADEFLMSPLRPGELKQRLARLLDRGSELEVTSNQLIQQDAALHLVGHSAAFQKAVRDLGRMALSGLPVLITGETGTGKDLCARVMHQLSNRRGYPFITADCSAIPGHLFENEMFGHAKGAFTDASRDHLGLVGMAEGGTLFLDEIDALAPETQAKLLRLLEEGTYRPLGSDRAREANVHVIAATNADLADAVRQQRFRPDLYFRLNVLTLHLPPLRQRRGDVALLAERFLLTHPAGEVHRSKRFSRSAVQALEEHDWPGNVRELRNVIQRAAVVAESMLITPDDLGVTRVHGTAATTTFNEKRKGMIESYERTLLEDALRVSEGNVTHAAKALGKDRRVVGRMMKRYGIDRRSFA